MSLLQDFTQDFGNSSEQGLIQDAVKNIWQIIILSMDASAQPWELLHIQMDNARRNDAFRRYAGWAKPYFPKKKSGKGHSSGQSRMRLHTRTW